MEGTQFGWLRALLGCGDVGGCDCLLPQIPVELEREGLELWVSLTGCLSLSEEAFAPGWVVGARPGLRIHMQFMVCLESLLQTPAKEN